MKKLINKAKIFKEIFFKKLYYIHYWYILPIFSNINIDSKKVIPFAVLTAICLNFFFFNKLEKKINSSIVKDLGCKITNIDHKLATKVQANLNLQEINITGNVLNFNGILTYSFESGMESLDFLEKFNLIDSCGKLDIKESLPIKFDAGKLIANFNLAGKSYLKKISIYFPFNYTFCEFIFINTALLPQVSQFETKYNAFLIPSKNDCNFIKKNSFVGETAAYPAAGFSLFLNEIHFLAYFLIFILIFTLFFQEHAFYLLNFNLEKYLTLKFGFLIILLVGLFLPDLLGVYETLIWKKIIYLFIGFYLILSSFFFYHKNKSDNFKKISLVIISLFVSICFWFFLLLKVG